MKPVLYVLIAAALLAGLFQLFKPGPTAPAPAAGDPVASAPAAPAPAATAPSATPDPLPAAGPAGSPAPMPGATLPERVDRGTTIDLVVANGRLVSGPTVVKVKQNDPVVFHVTSDVADELHLHGYNLHLRLKPHETATLEVRTTRMGRFTYELHHRDLELGALEVYPR